MIFRSLEKDDDLLIKKFLINTNNLYWEFSFNSLSCYKEMLEPKIYVNSDTLFLEILYLEEYYYYYVSILKNNANSNLEKIFAHIKEESIKKFHVYLNEEEIIELDENNYAYSFNDDYSDYIYNAKDLTELNGKKYHNKKNFITRFMNSYTNYSLEEYRVEFESKLLTFLKGWYHHHNALITLDEEESVIENIIKTPDHFNLTISLLLVNNEIVAFTIFENNNYYANVLFEKADINYQGSYQTINYLNANKYFKNLIYINRQEDMGIDGLRTAKQSYHPAFLLRRYEIKEIN
ncbi:MAG: phosphatidylglycerol lysyltransferase domain-containing protein [Acholeplasmatales bacterium]|jgi:hypothetical protein|nr:phosphatidylglycerol lysyltransferase domain-containing protein [Acholeplasmatales bacterium]